MDRISIILYIIASIIFIYGIFVLKKDFKNKVNLFYSLLFFVTSIWTIFISLSISINNAKQSLLISKLLYLFGILTPIIFFFFTTNYTKRLTSKIVSFLLILPILPLTYLLFTNKIISDVIIYPNNHSLIFTTNAWIYFFLFFAYFILSYIILIIHYFKISGIEKKRTQFLLWGTLIPSIFVSIFDIILTLFKNFEFVWVGPFFILFFLASMVYSTARFQFMGVKLIVKKNLISLITILLITLIAVGAKIIISQKISIYSWQINILILLFSLLLLPFFQRLFIWIAKNILNLPIFDPEKIIDHLNKSQDVQLSAHSACVTTISSLMDIFDLPAAAILIYHENKNEYLTEYSRGLDFPTLEKIIDDNKNEINDLSKKQIDYYFYGIDKFSPSLHNELKKENINFLFPLVAKNKNIGLILLSTKKHQEFFDRDSSRIIKIICDQAAISLENAILYDKAQEFNAKLKLKVFDATKDLQEANSRLIKIDKSKSDFISIASHQLRTPLTIIKGFTSMLLEGSFGIVPGKQIEPLKMVYQANDRLIQLIENLLNISRIEAGKLQFKYTITQLEDIVNNVIEELRTNANLKGLKLIWSKPSSPLPPLNIDEEKIRQVIMNLIENALKYTNEGEVNVKLEKNDNQIEFSVIDSGLGIKPGDLSKLFQKFSRGTGNTALKEGTGLGLYVARQMIEIHKGKIWAESDGENMGSKFIFQLPINS